MIRNRLKIASAATLLTLGAACQWGGSESQGQGSVTLSAPTLPAEVKDVKKWTYDLYCSAENSGEATRTSARFIASSDAAIDGAVKVTGDKVATVAAGWYCLMDMTTEEPVSGVKDAKPALASSTRKIFFSSVATVVPADRKLKLELTRQYATSASGPSPGGLGTATGTGTSNLGTATGTATGPGSSSATPDANGSGGTTDGSASAQITLKIQSDGEASCPLGKKFDTDPQIMACK